MALANILQAIQDEAASVTQTLQSAHQARMQEMKQSHEASVTVLRHAATQKLEQQKHQLRLRAEGTARMHTSQELLSFKRTHLDTLYTSVLSELGALPPKEHEVVLRSLLSVLPSSGGLVHPSKGSEGILKKILPDTCTLGSVISSVGGFRFESNSASCDMTFEFLVQNVLRSKTEAEVAAAIFSA